MPYVGVCLRPAVEVFDPLPIGVKSPSMPRKPFRVGRSNTGLGLFATALIEKGAFIVEYKGRRIPTREAQECETRYGSKYMFEINSRWTLDGSSRSNLARYLNHSCRPNGEPDLVQ